MSKQIAKTFFIDLTEKQYKVIAQEFLSCQLGSAAMLGQPAIWFGGDSSKRLKPPRMQMSVLTPELFHKLQAVLEEAGGGK